MKIGPRLMMISVRKSWFPVSVGHPNSPASAEMSKIRKFSKPDFWGQKWLQNEQNLCWVAVMASIDAPERRDTLFLVIINVFEGFGGSGMPLPHAVTQMAFKITNLVKSSHHPNMELFQKKGHEFIKVISYAKLKRITPKEMARILLRVLGKKRPYAIFVLMQTHMGGSMSMPHTHTESAHRNLLRTM